MGFRLNKLTVTLLVSLLVLMGACGDEKHPNTVEIDQVLATPVAYPFSFVMMGDNRTPGEIPFSRLLDQILDIDPAPVFVADIGDLVLMGTMGEYQLFISAIADYAIPFLSIIGNHEMNSPQGRDNYVELFGDEDFSFDYANCRFVALNDSVPSSYGLEDAQLTWLEDLLDDAAPPDKFVFMHVPPPFKELVGGTAREEEIIGGSKAHPNWDEFKDMVEAHGVRIVGLGHNHRYRHHLRNDVHYVITGGAGAELSGAVMDDPPDNGIFHHFVLVTIDAGGNSMAEIIKKGEGTTPDDRYTIEFETTVID